MGTTLYFVGAGLTKSLELGQRVPLMLDFVEVLTRYVNSDVALNALVQMELGKVYEADCPACFALASGIDGISKKGETVPEGKRYEFAALVRTRPRESIEALFERVESTNPNTVAAAYAHGLPALFRYAINHVFSTIGRDLNLHPLICFLRRRFTEDAGRTHVFVSFNYDLALDRAVELASDWEWQPQGGYGFDFHHFTVDGCAAFSTEPLATASSRIRILKPHGSLNWLRRRLNSAKQPVSGGIEASSMVLPLSDKLELRYWAIADPFHSITFPNPPGSYDFGSPNVEIMIAPPSPAKRIVLEAVRSAESAAIDKADEVFVIGYSMPKTDHDQRALISEAIGDRGVQRLTIINHNATPEYYEDVKSLFKPRLTPRTFNDGFAAFAAREEAFESCLGF